MAKKTFTEDVDLTWSGETVTRTLLGKQVNFTSANEKWNGTAALWTDDVITVIQKLLWGGSRGGVRKQWDTWNAWNKLNEKDKKKIVKVIVYLKSGVKLESKIDLNEYKITVEDIDLLVEEYEKYTMTVENVKVE